MYRLVILIILFFFSLLTLFKAPTYHLWLIAITVTEFSLLFCCFTILILFSGFGVNRYSFAGTITGVIALILYLSPVLKAYFISKDLRTGIYAEFGTNMQTDKAPFNLLGMFTSINNTSIPSKKLSYIAYPDKILTLDFYPARDAGKRPCVIVIHGGSWKSGDNKQLPELNSYLATSGYHVAAINYRLAPDYQNPLPVDDVKAAIRYLKDHADKLKIDSGNFVLLGRSAGAQIALLAAYTLKIPEIKGVIDFYGPADMVWGYSVPSSPLVMNSRKVMEDYLGGTYHDVPDNYAASSPLNYVSAASVPTLIIHGENDVLVAYEHSLRLQRKLNEKGVKNYFLSIPWATHGFDYTINGPGGQLSTFAVFSFLNSVTIN
ncbi:alpha/beta hydrolase [Pedobacter sp. P351]|uniref:alpha/beta hydrolase n=1 Tax=Pedobacter superstes TaxID=3133441 RepID=UPI0030970F92